MSTPGQLLCKDKFGGRLWTGLLPANGRAFITRDGEAIEGEALDDVTVIGVVTFTICDVRQDNAVV